MVAAAEGVPGGGDGGRLGQGQEEGEGRRDREGGVQVRKIISVHLLHLIASSLPLLKELLQSVQIRYNAHYVAVLLQQLHEHGKGVQETL